MAAAGTRLYTHNLPWALTNEELAAHFATAGEVKYASIMTYGNGLRSKGCAIVEMGTPDQAVAAVERLNDSELKGRKILVREDREPTGDAAGPKPPREPREPRADGTRGRGRGGATRGAPRGGAVGAPRDAVPRAPRAAAPGGSSAAPVGVPGKTAYVGNLPWSTTSESLKAMFARFRPVSSTVSTSASGRSRGWGLVVFNTPEEANTAITSMNNFDVEGRPLNVRLDRGAPEHA